MVLRLSERFRGGGMLRLQETTSAAYIGAVIACATGVGHLDSNERVTLEGYATAAYNEVCALIGEPDGLAGDSPARQCLPAEASALSKGPYALSDYENNNKCTAMATLSGMMARTRRNALEDECTNPQNFGDSLTKADAVWILSDLNGGLHRARRKRGTCR